MMQPFAARDELRLRAWIEGRLWPDGPTCSVCQAGARITKRKNGYFRCNACQIDFTCKTGTLVEGSHIPLFQWFNMMSIVARTTTSVSVAPLSEQLALTQKSTRYMLHRLYQAFPLRSKGPEVLTEWDLADVLFRFKPAQRQKSKRARSNILHLGVAHG